MSDLPATDWLGRSLARVDGTAKLTGRCRFLSDLRFDGMLHARQVPSPEAHARLLAVDCRAARQAPGVHAVLSAADVSGENRVGVILDDQPLFAHDRLRYRGETVAITDRNTSSRYSRGRSRTPPLEAGAPDVVSSIRSRKSPAGSSLRSDERPGPDTTAKT